jgi:hypothetical protein
MNEGWPQQASLFLLSHLLIGGCFPEEPRNTRTTRKDLLHSLSVPSVLSVVPFRGRRMDPRCNLFIAACPNPGQHERSLHRRIVENPAFHQAKMHSAATGEMWHAECISVFHRKEAVTRMRQGEKSQHRMTRNPSSTIHTNSKKAKRPPPRMLLAPSNFRGGVQRPIELRQEHVEH